MTRGEPGQSGGAAAGKKLQIMVEARSDEAAKGANFRLQLQICIDKFQDRPALLQVPCSDLSPDFSECQLVEQSKDLVKQRMK